MSRMYKRVCLRANYESVSNCSDCIILHCNFYCVSISLIWVELSEINVMCGRIVSNYVCFATTITLLSTSVKTLNNAIYSINTLYFLDKYVQCCMYM